MPLVPHATFPGYLEKPERDALEDAFNETGVDYDQPTRRRLLDGINRVFARDFLPRVSFDPVVQFGNDLDNLNRFERLTDGTVPLTQFLRNVVRRLSVVPQREVFEDALRKVSGESETTTPVVAANEIPAVDFEEITKDELDDFLEISFLQVGVLRLPSVAKLLVPYFNNGQQLMMPDGVNPSYGAGTGWMIASDIILTNYHVLRNRPQAQTTQPSAADLMSQALGMKAHFFFDSDSAVGLKIDVKELIAYQSDRSKDFALLRLAQSPKVDVLPLFTEKFDLPEPVHTPKGTVTKALAVNIIQHPDGGRKRLALRNNLVYKADYPKLHYFTDTLGGSSGSPVFDDAWRVVALHRAAVQTKAEFQGKILGYVNEGIQLHAILADLAEMAKTSAPVKTALDQITAEQAALGN
jgi:hypothetical protein